MTPLSSTPHKSVLMDETLQYLSPKEGDVIVDGTFGAGGHSRAILESAACSVYGIDRDPSATYFADLLSKDFPKHFTLLEGPFSDMDILLDKHGISKVDGILLDIGVSSMQIDQAERGFSFMQDGPLDMRMGQHGISAAEWINSVDEKQMADVIYQYGDEHDSRRIAHAICESRKTQPITTTKALAEVVRSAIRHRPKHIDPATKTFQAIRIWINDELGELERALEKSKQLLRPGGRLVVITFHSLEDRIVKQFFQQHSEKKQHINKYAVKKEEEAPPSLFQLLTRKAVEPSEAEIAMNIRARSAKLRAAVRTSKGDDL